MSNTVFRIESDIKPLAIAANATQADNARLDIVLITLGHLFFQYSDVRRFAPPTSARILASLEKRWAKCKDDREIYVLAVVFNPYIKTAAFRRDNPATTTAALYVMVQRCYKRMFKTDGDPEMKIAFLDYLRGMEEFSREEMGLDDAKIVASRLVRCKMINNSRYLLTVFVLIEERCQSRRYLENS